MRDFECGGAVLAPSQAAACGSLVYGKGRMEQASRRSGGQAVWPWEVERMAQFPRTREPVVRGALASERHFCAFPLSSSHFYLSLLQGKSLLSVLLPYPNISFESVNKCSF